MRKITHLLLVLTILGAGQVSADSTKNAQPGVTVAHTDNRAAGWIDVEVEDLSGLRNVKCHPSANAVADGDFDVEGCIISESVHGITEVSPLFIGSGFQHGQTSPINREAANCLLKNINKARSDTAALAVLESCNVLHPE